jgi:hypothetical protein|tara:strand:+ start:413 stop:733 length:321 start_codon:yes stop_codon:yes gene_type:complete
MAIRDKRTIEGIKAELEVQLEFTQDPNLIVFTPLMGLGLVDIVTLNRETGEFKAYDVKSRNYRKSNYIAKDGCYRKTKGRLILRPRTKEQKKLGVEIIYPKERDDK